MALWVPQYIGATSGSPTYSAQRARMLVAGLTPTQQGVAPSSALLPTPLKVTKTTSEQEEIGPRSVYIQPGELFIKAAGTRHGYYHVVNDAKYELALPTTATSPTQSMDMVIVKIEDSTDIGGANNRAIFDVVPGPTGTPSSIGFNNPIAAQLGTLPSNAMPLAYIENENDVVVGPGSIMDARAWSSGAFMRSEATTDSVISSTSYVSIFSGNSRRFMSSSGLVRVRMQCWASMAAAIFSATFAVKWNDTSGLDPAGSNISDEWIITNESAAAREVMLEMEWYVDVPVNTSIVMGVVGKVNASNITLNATGANERCCITYEEIVRPSAFNNTGGV